MELSQINPLMNHLVSQAETLGLSLSSDNALLMIRHFCMVIEKNEQINLTRITDPHDAIVRHYIDSLLFVKVLEDSHCLSAYLSNSPRFLDLGTGAGFPGIPFSIVTEMDGLLIDSITKKIHAVRKFIVNLGLDSRISALSIRAEDLARRSAASFDLVLVRAVAKLSILIEYASPLLKPNGLLVSSKAYIEANELVHAEGVAQLCGMKLVSRETYDLPHSSGHRELICFMKTEEATVSLPRKPGMAVHRPL